MHFTTEDETGAVLAVKGLRRGPRLRLWYGGHVGRLDSRFYLEKGMYTGPESTKKYRCVLTGLCPSVTHYPPPVCRVRTCSAGLVR